MKNANVKDKIAGTILLIFGISLWIVSPLLITESADSSTLDSTFFPKFVGVSLIILSVTLIIKSFLSNPQTNTNKTKEKGAASHKKASTGYLSFIVIIFFVYIVEWISFLPAAIISMVAIMGIMRVQKWHYYRSEERRVGK